MSNLPLARLQAGFSSIEIGWRSLTQSQRAKAVMLLAEANSIGAHMEGAYLSLTHSEEVTLAWAHLNLADFTGTHLEETNITGAYLEEASLNNAILGDKRRIGPRLVDAYWDKTHLAVVDWSQIKKLGEEYQAQQKKDNKGKIKNQ